MRQSDHPRARTAALAPFVALFLGGCLELGGSWTPSETATDTAIATDTAAGSTTTATGTSTATTSASSSTTAGADTTGPAPLVCSSGQILRCVENDDGRCGPESTCVDLDGCDPRTCEDDGEFDSTSCDELCGDGYGCVPSDDDAILHCVYDPEHIKCSTWEQSCPDGWKCTIWADNGGSSWNATKCAQLSPRPKQIGEPCTFTGTWVDGEDDCDRGLYCWDVDWETKVGACTPFCSGSEQDAMCPEDYYCGIWFQRSGLDVSLCIAPCDPLAQDCVGEDSCLPVDGGWSCVLDASGEEGAYGDPCEYVNACDPGLLCLNPEYVPDCNAGGCCSPLCDLGAPNTCPGADQLCTPWYDEGEALDGYEHIGVCALPQ